MTPRCCQPFTAIILLAIAIAGCSQSGGNPTVGTVEVRVTAEPRTKPVLPDAPAVDPYAKQDLGSGEFTLVDYGGLKGVVIWIESADTKPASATLSLNPTAADADTPVIAATAGGDVIVENHTGARQVVYATHEVEGGLDWEPIPDGESRSVRTTKPGTYTLFSDSQELPVAILLVVQASHVAVVSVDRSAVFSDMPAGEYRIHCWHQRFPGTDAIVKVVPGKVTIANLRVSANELSRGH